MVPVLGLTHYVYAITIILVILLMLKKKDVVIVCLVGTIIIAALQTKSLVSGTQVLFNAILNAGIDLFDIMLVISLTWRPRSSGRLRRRRLWGLF
jgi:hypothetical protein